MRYCMESTALFVVSTNHDCRKLLRLLKVVMVNLMIQKSILSPNRTRTGGIFEQNKNR